MFANFFGIVIISVSALLIAGLVLRADPNLPAIMNLGLVDKSADSTQLTTSVATDSSDAGSSSANNAETGSSTTDASLGTASSSSSTDNNASGSSSSSDTATGSTTGNLAADDATDTTVASDSSKSTSDNEKAAKTTTPATDNSQGFSEAYLESKRRARELSGSSQTRTNKSDSVRYKD